MNHIVRIAKVKALRPYIIELTFTDGKIKTVDLEPVLYGEMYSPLRDEAVFNQVRVNPEVCTIEWPNGADFDPATLYNWDEHVQELSQRCKEWEMVEHEG